MQNIIDGFWKARDKAGGASRECRQGYFSYRGSASLSDLAAPGAWNDSVAALVTTGPAGNTAPEPGTLMLLLSAAIGLQVLAWNRNSLEIRHDGGSGIRVSFRQPWGPSGQGIFWEDLVHK